MHFYINGFHIYHINHTGFSLCYCPTRRHLFRLSIFLSIIFKVADLNYKTNYYFKKWKLPSFFWPLHGSCSKTLPALPSWPDPDLRPGCRRLLLRYWGTGRWSSPSTHTSKKGSQTEERLVGCWHENNWQTTRNLTCAHIELIMNTDYWDNKGYQTTILNLTCTHFNQSYLWSVCLCVDVCVPFTQWTFFTDGTGVRLLLWCVQ